MSDEQQSASPDQSGTVHPEEIEDAEQVRDRPSRHADDSEGAHAAGDSLGGDRLPTGNDGTAGGTTPSGDAGLNESSDVAPEGD